MHDAIIVISKKEDLDWSRLEGLSGVNSPQFLTVKGNGHVAQEYDAPFIMIPEVLPHKIITRHALNFLEQNSFSSVLAAVHETCREQRKKSLDELEKQGIQIQFFHHEENDPLWRGIDGFIKCLEKHKDISEIFENLLSLCPDHSVSILRNEVLEPLAAAHILYQTSPSPDATGRLWDEIREASEKVLHSGKYQLLCHRAGCHELSDTLEQLLRNTAKEQPEIDEGEFVRAAEHIARCLEPLYLS